MRFLGLEMARAEKCTKSCMFNQMLVKGWDAHSVADVVKEKKRGEKKEYRPFLPTGFY